VIKKKERKKRMPPGRQIRALDRLEMALKLPLEHLSDKVVVLLDHSQQLSRLGPAVEELMLELPELLQHADQLVFVFVGRLPLSCLGVPVAREPPAVAFHAYSTSDVEGVLSRSLSSFAHASACVRGLMTFAVPYVGHNLHDLLRIGEEVLCADHEQIEQVGHMGREIERLVQQRLGLCDLSGLLEQGQEVEGPAAACAATMRRMVHTEKRLLVAAYLASRLHKDDDVQHFMPAGRGRHCRRASMVRHEPDALQEPTSVSLPRLLAAYHRLARQDQVLSPLLLEQLMSLHVAGLVRFPGGPISVDKDAKVVCRAELPLVKACASDLGVHLREYGLAR